MIGGFGLEPSLGVATKPPIKATLLLYRTCPIVRSQGQGRTMMSIFLRTNLVLDLGNQCLRPVVVIFNNLLVRFWFCTLTMNQFAM